MQKELSKLSDEMLELYWMLEEINVLAEDIYHSCTETDDKSMEALQQMHKTNTIKSSMMRRLMTDIFDSEEEIRGDIASMM